MIVPIEDWVRPAMRRGVENRDWTDKGFVRHSEAADEVTARTEGAIAELVVARVVHADWEFYHGPNTRRDLVLADRRTIEVKWNGTSGPNAWFYMDRSRKLEADYGVLVTPHGPDEMAIRGWITREDYYANFREVTWRSKNKPWGVPVRDLAPIPELLQILQISA